MFKKKLLVVTVSMLLSSTTYAGTGHWSYEGDEGPEHWAELSPEFARCGDGKNQTPIDIANPVKAQLEPIKIDYHTLTSDVVNNGHSVQASVEPGSSITVDGIKFDLKQYHFHTPSENMVNGKHADMEIHFVHADKDGNLAVLGVFLDQGKKNETLAHLWKHMPHHVGEHGAPEGKINPADLLPKSRQYYRFSGSLTTPPCTEGVRWLVFKEHLPVSKEQVEEFSKAVHGKDARPVQSLGARVILLSD